MSVKITSYVPQTIKANKAGSVGGMTKIATQIVNQEKALSPVDKGLLRSSIKWEKEGKSEIVGGTNVEYAIYQEYGTRKMSAQPFMRPGFDIVAKGVSAVKAMAKAMMDSVKKVTK